MREFSLDLSCLHENKKKEINVGMSKGMRVEGTTLASADMAGYCTPTSHASHVSGAKKKSGDVDW